MSLRVLFVTCCVMAYGSLFVCLICVFCFVIVCLLFNVFVFLLVICCVMLYGSLLCFVSV